MIKSETDLEQAKKLAAGILPIESADMMFEYDANKDTYLDNPTKIPIKDYVFINDIPCWSLSALIKVLPKIYKEDECYIPLVGKYYEGSKYICGYFGNGLLQWSIAENPIDAVFEMIIWLKENNKL